MRRHLSVWIAACLAAALAAPASASASVTITLKDDNSFNPRSATLDLGAGSFDWRWGPGGAGTIERHNVRQDVGLFDSGEPVSSKPAGFSVTASAGSYPYFCIIHLGMEGDVNVRPVLDPSDTGRGPIRVAWASATTTTGDSYDVRFRSGKKWEKWKRDTPRVSGVFGKNRKPVKVKGGRRYKLQARSRDGEDRSEWSPTLVVER
jgi:plastocyanin